MIERMLKITVLAVFVVAAPAQAQSARETPISTQAAAVIAGLFDQAPFRTWDDLRTATPRGVHWHLAPPDRADAETFRRSGWLEADGRQAGIAACGVRSGPEIVVLRIAGATSGIEVDPVIGALERTLETSVEYYEPTMVGEITRYQVHALDGTYATLLRETNCSGEGNRAARRCDTTYTIYVRPNYASAPRVRDCRAP
jgi:hypothetical protein